MSSLSPSATTYFDTAGRQPVSRVAQTAHAVQGEPYIEAMLEAIPGATFLLNTTRQIVLANKAGWRLAESLGASDGVTGLRLGEALACLNVPLGPDGCGTAPRCRHCGMGQANLAFTRKPGEYDTEFRLRSLVEGVEVTHTFAAHVSPFQVFDETMRLCSLTDITAAKSRETHEHIFFHDVLNTAQAVHGAADLLPGQEDPEAVEELAHVVSRGSARLIEEIQAQRDLRRAEDGTLAATLVPASVAEIVTDTVQLYRHSRFARGRTIELETGPEESEIPTSRTHLTRVVGNLIKNALEASAVGEAIHVRVVPLPTDVQIHVHNAAVMPEAVQAQIFQRFFSTKASSGRGLGTYGVRLLVTRVLGGTVTFRSTPEVGTVFSVQLPRGAA
jgi:nitrogen-specific signal transduction histidine kinase